MNIIEKIEDIQDCINKYPNTEIVEMLEELKEDVRKKIKIKKSKTFFKRNCSIP